MPPEMAPSVQLLPLIEIQVERDGEGKSRGQTELMSKSLDRRAAARRLFRSSEREKALGSGTLTAAI